MTATAARPDTPAATRAPRASQLARSLTASGILRIADEIREMLALGQPVTNLTVGDFSPTEFRPPQFLCEAIGDAIRAGETNYPPTAGMPALRHAVRAFYKREFDLDYDLPAVIAASGARPILYGAYRAVVDPGDRVVFPVPSWNNEHYCTITEAEQVRVATTPESSFLPDAAALREPLRDARLLVLNSPVNPTGTAFTADALAEICDVVLEENARRSADERPLYLLYDQVYWMLTFGDVRHATPVTLRPEMRPYTIYADAASKPFAATGIRVGWGLGPADIIRHMADIISHAGAWAPRAEQVATARLLESGKLLDDFMVEMRHAVLARLDAIYKGCAEMQRAGYPVEAIPPRGAIYLSVRFALHGRRTSDGELLKTDEDVRRFILHQAGVAVIPFQIFGYPDGSGWCRLSAGAVSVADVEAMFPRLRAALDTLQRD